VHCTLSLTLALKVLTPKSVFIFIIPSDVETAVSAVAVKRRVCRGRRDVRGLGDRGLGD
jgi:hypothetical protein